MDAQNTAENGHVSANPAQDGDAPETISDAPKTSAPSLAEALGLAVAAAAREGRADLVAELAGMLACLGAHSKIRRVR